MHDAMSGQILCQKVLTFAGFNICHNDYQELQSIVETGRLLLSVPLPGFDILVQHARTFFFNLWGLTMSQQEAPQTTVLRHTQSSLIS